LEDFAEDYARMTYEAIADGITAGLGGKRFEDQKDVLFSKQGRGLRGSFKVKRFAYPAHDQV
jgi:hypothetical protein